MNPLLLPAAGTRFGKRQVVIIVIAIITVISLPAVALATLGSNTLAFLANTLGVSDNTVAVSTTTVGLYEGPEVPGDAYTWGNCTYWVYALRLKAEDPIPTTWGNAATWAPRALLDGYVVDHIPSPGAIMQTSNSAGGLGHVAYVTAVDPTGTWTISEMNVKGLDVVDTSTYPQIAAANYNFIHDKTSEP